MQWDRLNEESDKAYSAFRIYLEMSGRSYAKVAQKLRKSCTLIRRWAKEYNWQARASAYDASVVEARRQAEIERNRRLNTKLGDIYELMLERAQEIFLSKKSGTLYAATQMVAEVSKNTERMKTEETPQRIEVVRYSDLHGE